MELFIISVIILIGILGHRFLEPLVLIVLRFYEGLIVNTDKGRELQSQLKSFFGQIDSSILLPQYKFFTPLCFEVRELQLRHGLSSFSVLNKLRPWISKDVQFEEKILGQLKSSMAQFFILSLFTWIFYLNARFSLEISSNWKGFTALQLIGFISFLLVFKKQKSKFFWEIEALSQRAFLFRSLKEVGLSMSEVLSKSKADQSFQILDPQIKNQGELLIKLCQRWTVEGCSIEEDLSEIISELDFLREERRRHFEVRLGALRFIHLVSFYLLGYFLVILELIRHLALSY